MPTRKHYVNFYHWYCTIAQFAQREIQTWIKSSIEDDKLIMDALALLDSLKTKETKVKDPLVDYTMIISVKQPAETNLAIVKNKLLAITSQQIGEQLKIVFKNQQEKGNEYSQNSNKLKILFKLGTTACDKLKDIVCKWPQYQNIEIKVQVKQKRN